MPYNIFIIGTHYCPVKVLINLPTYWNYTWYNYFWTEKEKCLFFARSASLRWKK